MPLKGCLEYQELLALRLCGVRHAAGVVYHLVVIHSPSSIGNVNSNISVLFAKS